MEINVIRPKKVNVKSVHFCVKAVDTGTYSLYDDGDELIISREGYVPPFVPGEYGDYIEMEIDLDTGQILNWAKPDPEELKDWIEEGMDKG